MKKRVRIRHCERSEAIKRWIRALWIASSRSLSSGAHSRDPLAPRNDGFPSGAHSRDPLATLLRMGTPAASHQQINQMRDQRNVRRRHWIVAQFVGADPGELLPLPRDHLA